MGNWGLCLAALLTVMAPSLAQGQEFGLGSILNPEGSRLFPSPVVLPRHAGKPDPRWRGFSWSYVDENVNGTPYRLYFYQEEADWPTRFAMPQLDEEIRYLQGVFNYKPKKQFAYLLFSSLRDFQEANIFDIEEGVEGITSTTEATMAIPYWGDASAYRHVSTHEMTHQFQVQKINDLSGDDSKAQSAFPLWFIEGMAEYYSLHGMDTESRFYLRDLVANSDEKSMYVPPKFFEDGPQSFIYIYKAGQAKCDFLESRYGKGTLQRIIERVSKNISKENLTFQETVSKILGKSEADIEAAWRDYLGQEYRREADRLTQPLELYDPVEAAGDTLDAFSMSPDGKLLAIRDVDPDTGVVSIHLLDREHKDARTVVARDHESDVLSLYFFEQPIIALGDREIAYFAMTIAGPELTYRSIARDSKGNIKLGSAEHLSLYRNGLVEASGPSFSPDGKELAFVGLDQAGWKNVYIAALDGSPNPPRKITSDYYSWQTLSWGKDGILGASDRTPAKKHNIFLLDPKTGALKRVTYSTANQYAPDGDADCFVFQSWESGSAQVHLYLHGHEVRLTDAKTELVSPQFRQGNLYALGFEGGRFHLYRIPGSPLNQMQIQPARALSTPPIRRELVEEAGTVATSEVPQAAVSPPPSVESVSASATESTSPSPSAGTNGSASTNESTSTSETSADTSAKTPQPLVPSAPAQSLKPDQTRLGGWSPQLASPLGDQAHPYHSFSSSGIRLDYLTGFFATGSVFGLSTSVSDLMRDASVSADAFVYDGINDFDLFYSRQKGRTKWTLGAYQIGQPRLDSVFSDDGTVRTYVYREVGVLGALTYPFGAFSHMDIELRLGDVNRTDYNDPYYAPSWYAINPGNEFAASPVFRIGYDRILYEVFTGPYEGYSALFEADTSVFPRRQDVTERLRLDLASYWSVAREWVFGVQGLFGSALGGLFKNPFLVSSDDIMRAYPFGDPRLQGNFVAATKAELRFPIGNLFGFPPLRGLVGADLGTIYQHAPEAAQDVSSSYTGGLALNFPPLAINFLLSKPLMIAPGPLDPTVFHFTLRYLYL